MSDLSATIRLRPIRIALLVRPSNLTAIKTFMRASTCLWGGMYNPIIPVFRIRPKEWRKDISEQLTGADVARGYIKFFEPDAFVESEPNLLEKIGIHGFRDNSMFRNRVFQLEDLLTCQRFYDWSELSIGLSVFDILKHVHESEQRFELRDKNPAYLVKSNSNTSLIEAVFGRYPTDKPSAYINKAYNDVFEPMGVDATPDTWIKVYKHNAITPLQLTKYKLEMDIQWRSDPVFYFFDPKKSTDLIDLWNLRLEPRPLFPVPIDWWPDLAGEINNMIAVYHRPMQGNPHGVMHRTRVEFSRSIDDALRNDVIDMLNSDLIPGSYTLKTSRSPIWNQYEEEIGAPNRPLRITAKEKRITLTVREEEALIADFPALAPDFASLYGSGLSPRWVNVVHLLGFGRHEIATVLPFNVIDQTWPRLEYDGGPVVVGTEGWSFGLNHKNSTEIIQLLTHVEAVIGSLKRLGIEASLSDPGHIAKQVLHHLGGMWGISLLADAETLKLLNKMAGGLRKRGEGEKETEELFERRTASEQEWRGLISRRRETNKISQIDISRFTDHNVLRLGLNTECPHCTDTNWHSLTNVDYDITCGRCLERYSFPQGELKSKNGNWSYRVIGPFSTPDYARGSYGALLALRVLQNIHSGPNKMTFSPALSLKIDNAHICEADYVAWISEKSLIGNTNPRLVIGEAKSFGNGDLIKSHDIKQLRLIVKKLPGAIIVISVMRDEFTLNEKRIILSFVKSARRTDKKGRITNPVILLTGVELFYQHDLLMTWKDKGGRHAEFADYNHTSDLLNLASSTQAIYLGLPPFSNDI